MSLQKVIGITIICLLLAGPVLAQNGSQGQPSGNASIAQATGGEPQGQGSGAKVDYGKEFDAMDTNRDLKVTRDEWLASGMTQDSYDNQFAKMLDTDKDGILTKAEYTAQRSGSQGGTMDGSGGSGMNGSGMGSSGMGGSGMGGSGMGGSGMGGGRR